MRGQKLFLVLFAVLPCIVAGGCGAAAQRVDPDRRLPFIVRVREVKVPRVEEAAAEDGTLTPALFPDEKLLTGDLVRSLEEAGIFSFVATEDEKRVTPDLELEVEIRGRDFGPGEPLIGGAIFSSLAWLFAGHLSWFIEDRQYPGSSMLMSVRIWEPRESIASSGDKKGSGPEARPLFQDDLPIQGLQLPFAERADTAHWFLNILLPPWWGDGDSRVAGSSLAAKSIEFFASQGPERILSRLPGDYFKEVQSFLVYDRASNAALIASKQAIRELSITRTTTAGRSVRKVDQESLETFEAKGEARKEEARLNVSNRATGIGTTASDRYYAVPLRRDEKEFVRVEALLANGERAGPWTIYSPST